MGATFFSARGRFAALAGFALLVALTGGGSRADIVSLLILRPAAVLFAAWALILASGDDLRAVRPPLLIVLALMCLALLQLVPLPPDLWAALPQRGFIAEFAALAGFEPAWRPLSMDPNRTWNTFFALMVPLAAILLVAIQQQPYRRHVIALLIALAALSAGFGILQALGARQLELYAITNAGFPVGLFSNRNHQSILLLWLMVAVSWYATTLDPRRFSVKARLFGALALIVLLFPLVVLTGSRAGLLLSLPTLALCAFLLLRAPDTREALAGAGRRAGAIVLAGFGLIACALAYMLFALGGSSRETALLRLLRSDEIEEARTNLLPTYWQMAVDFMPLGSGFGSFENVFRIYEPAETLTTRYMNQAHNEPMQLAIEGGLPALLILGAALAWLVLACWRLMRSERVDGLILAGFFAGGLALFLVSSLVDYPLRTPLAAMLVACLTARLAILSRPQRFAAGAEAQAGGGIEMRARSG